MTEPAKPVDNAGGVPGNGPEAISGGEGGGLLLVDLVGTVVFALATAIAAVSDADGVQVLNLVVAGVLFVGGCVGFAVGFLRAAGRSRTEVVDLAGLFYLTGSAPREVRRRFLGLWFAQIAIATLAIAVTSPPFGVMAPVWGIGVITWWASLNATFPLRKGAPRR